MHAAWVPWPSRDAAARVLTLIPWFLTAARSWWHLAALAGFPTGDEDFIAWMVRNTEAREALETLCSMGTGTLKALAGRPDKWDNCGRDGPGHTLAALAAAYSGVPVPAPVGADVARVLTRLGRARTISGPSVALLTRLRPAAINDVLGPDLAGMADRDLGLPPGTSGEVVRVILKRIGPAGDDTLQRLADRSLGKIPVTPLPDYGDYSGGAHVIDARITSASLVRAGLAVPDRMTPDDYVTSVRDIWTSPHAAKGKGKGKGTADD